MGSHEAKMDLFFTCKTQWKTNTAHHPEHTNAIMENGGGSIIQVRRSESVGRWMELNTEQSRGKHSNIGTSTCTQKTSLTKTLELFIQPHE